VNYIVRGRSDDTRAASIKPFQELLITRDGQTSLGQDVERRRKIISMVVSETKTIGQGSERGM